MLAPGPELRIPGTAAQTRMVSTAKIRLDSRKSTRPFKGIICDDISEFESHMPSKAVRLKRAVPISCSRNTRDPPLALVIEVLRETLEYSKEVAAGPR
jgi:hypothetical protein